VQHWVYAGIHLYLHLPAIHAYAYAYSYTNSASSVANRDCDFHTDTQTKPHSETSHYAEAAPNSAAKTVGRANNWERTLLACWSSLF
jgi:hypothetical protein